MKRSFTLFICLVMLIPHFAGCSSDNSVDLGSNPTESFGTTASETDVISIFDSETELSEIVEAIESELTEIEEETDETVTTETVVDTVFSEEVTAGSAEDTETSSAVTSETSKAVSEKPKTSKITEKTEVTTTEASTTTQLPVESTSPPEPVFDGSVKTKRFRIKTPEGFSLSAAYTYVNDEEKHPAVFFIAGVGESNMDMSNGTLAPTKEIAEGLAERGINSFRIDKRNLWYMSEFLPTDGLEKEYLIDCRMGIQYLKDQKATDGIFLIGHSFGAQIASVLAYEDRSIDGVIAFHSTARHVADLLCDRYILDEPDKRSYYNQMRKGAMNATYANATGAKYLYGTDYYWASVNDLVDTANNFLLADVPLLIVNSTADLLCFQEDIDLWYRHFGNKSNAKIIIDDKMSHTGYEVDMTDPEVFNTPADFPQWVIDEFADFIKKY